MISPNVETFIGCDSSYRAADIVLYGAPFDSTTSYRPGARFGPSAIRHESFGLETYSPYQNADLTDFDVFDSGDLELCFGSSEAALADIEARAAEIDQLIYSSCVLLAQRLLNGITFFGRYKFKNIINSAMERVAYLFDGIKGKVIISFQSGYDICTKTCLFHQLRIAYAFVNHQVKQLFICYCHILPSLCVYVLLYHTNVNKSMDMRKIRNS